MLRWMILAGSFALWAGCMTLVYFNFRPRQANVVDADGRASIEYLFSENAETRRAWKIYADPADVDEVIRMFGTPGGGMPPANAPRQKVYWDGVDEITLQDAGRLETELKNKRDTSLDEVTTLDFALPGTPFSAHCVSKAHLSFENGLEDCAMDFTGKYDGLTLDAASVGARNGDFLDITTHLSHSGQTLYAGKKRTLIGRKAAPNVELAPFQFNPVINVGSEWNVKMIDFDLAMKGSADALAPLHVRCVGKRTILWDGKQVAAFEVHSDGGEARAWYSADGVVLKQAYMLLGVFKLMIVRDEKAAGQR